MKVLFVCTGNRDRSPTAERLFRDWKGMVETKSAGTEPAPGRMPLTQELLDWADLVVCMESSHVEQIKTNFNCTPSKLKTVNIADKYFRDDRKLIRVLKEKVLPLLEANSG